MHDAKFRYGSDDRLIRREDGSAIPDDEPTFTIRGKDEVGVVAIRAYIATLDQEAGHRIRLEEMTV